MPRWRVVSLVAALLLLMASVTCNGRTAVKKVGNGQKAFALVPKGEQSRAADADCPGPVGELEVSGLVAMDYCTFDTACDQEIAKEKQCLIHFGRECRGCKSCEAGMCDATHQEVSDSLKVVCPAQAEIGGCGTTSTGRALNACGCYGEATSVAQLPTYTCGCRCRSS